MNYFQRIHQSFSKNLTGIISVLSNSSVTLINDIAFHTRVIGSYPTKSLHCTNIIVSLSAILSLRAKNCLIFYMYTKYMNTKIND